MIAFFMQRKASLSMTGSRTRLPSQKSKQHTLPLPTQHVPHSPPPFSLDKSPLFVPVCLPACPCSPATPSA